MDTRERRIRVSSDSPTQPAIRLPRFAPDGVLPPSLPPLPLLRHRSGDGEGRVAATGALVGVPAAAAGREGARHGRR